MNPFMKYPGGKSKEAPLVIKYMPKNTDRYIEPFVGGGSIFYALEICPSLINDKSKDLYNLYSLIKKQDKKFKKYLENIDELWRHIEHNNDANSDAFETIIDGKDYDTFYESAYLRKKASIKKIERKGTKISDIDKSKIEITARKTAVYMCLRAKYNHDKVDKALRAALFFFLREYCYSSMFRFASNGDFNVPYGGMSYNQKYLTSKINYIFSEQMANLMSETTICNKDFAAFMDSIELAENDFIFLDPPYDSDFSTYDKNTFGKKEQIRLRDYLKSVPSKWMLIIKKTDFIYDLYKDFYVFEYDMNYVVSFKNRNEKTAKHLLITNYSLLEEGTLWVGGGGLNQEAL